MPLLIPLGRCRRLHGVLAWYQHQPVVIEFASGGGTTEAAARAGHRDLVTGPMVMDMT
jgi:hypothetical protein